MTRTGHAIRSILFATMPFAAMLFGATDAHANEYRVGFHRRFPAVNCAHQPGITFSGGALFSFFQGQSALSCPLEVDGDNGSWMRWTEAYVSPFFNPTQCWIAVTARDGSFYQLHPVKTTTSGYDIVYWGEFVVPGAHQAVIECWLNKWQKFTGYYSNANFTRWDTN
jgi:hypothetical protein